MEKQNPSCLGLNHLLPVLKTCALTIELLFLRPPRSFNGNSKFFFPPIRGDIFRASVFFEDISYTMEPPNSGHVGIHSSVLCREVVLYERSAQDQPLNIYLCHRVISYVTTANWIYVLLHGAYVQGLFPCTIMKRGKQQRQ